MDSGSILRIIAALLGVISAILLGAWLIRRSGVLGQQARRHDLRVQASLALGPRHRIVLVSVEGERMLLGLSPQNIQHLATLPPGAAEAEAGDIPAASLPNGNAAPVAGSFQRALNQWRAAQP